MIIWLPTLIILLCVNNIFDCEKGIEAERTALRMAAIYSRIPCLVCRGDGTLDPILHVSKAVVYQK